MHRGRRQCFPWPAIFASEKSAGDILQPLGHLLESTTVVFPHTPKCCSDRNSASLCLLSIAVLGKVAQDGLVIEGQSRRGNFVDGQRQLLCARLRSSSGAENSWPEVLRDIIKGSGWYATGPG